jgi:hypothetical protein
MSEQPEALRLADALDRGTYLLSRERQSTAAELRRLHTEIERLRADAERYRWLRKTCYREKYPYCEFDHAMHLSFTVSGIWSNNRFPAVLDACIDTEMEKEPKPCA